MATLAVLEAERYHSAHQFRTRAHGERATAIVSARAIKPLSSATAAPSSRRSGVDLDDVLRRAVRLLAQLTC